MYYPYSETNADSTPAPELSTLINESSHLLSGNVCYPSFNSLREQVINPYEKEPLPSFTPNNQSFVKYDLPDQTNSLLSEQLSCVERKTQEWIQERLGLISVLEQMIHALDYQQQEAAKKKANGTATNLVGAALIRKFYNILNRI